MSEITGNDLAKLAEYAARNIGEFSQEDIQMKLASVLADRLGLKADAKESLIRGDAIRGEEGYLKAMMGRSQSLKNLVPTQKVKKTEKEEKEVKEKLTKDQLLEQTILSLKQSALMLMDMVQDVVYDMIDSGEDADAVYERIMKAYDRNPTNADRFIQKQVNNLKGELTKVKDPEKQAAIQNAIDIFGKAQWRLWEERGEELKADRAALSKASKADPKLATQGAAEALYAQLLSAATNMAFETEVLGKNTDFDNEIMPTLSLVLHMAGKEINQGQGQMEVPHLADTMRLVKNAQGLLSAFRVNQEGMRVLYRSWDSQISSQIASAA